MINNLYIQKDFGEFTTILCKEKIEAVYVYLLKDKKIISDLWLFNTGDTPKLEPWLSSNKPPFLNSKKYSYASKLCEKDLNQDNFKFNFFISNKFGLCVKIYMNSILIGIIPENTKPGWSFFAKKDGPLANRLESFNG